jgi:hypothetical protein
MFAGKARCLPTFNVLYSSKSTCPWLQPLVIFASKARANQSGAHFGYSPLGKAQALAEYIRQGFKGFVCTNVITLLGLFIKNEKMKSFILFTPVIKLNFLICQ